MKKVILMLAFLIPVLVFGQTRIRDLSTQATYDGSCYVAVDKAGYTTTKKMSLSVLTGTEATQRKSQDTLTRRGVGLTDAGNYKTDETTHYLTAAAMSGYDTNSVLISTRILDSLIYKVRNQLALWDTGSVGTSTIRYNASNQAVGSYSFSTNYQNVAQAYYSNAFGNKAVANNRMSIALGGGSYLAKYGAQQSIEFIARGNTKASADTLEVDEVKPLSIPTDAAIGFEIYIIGTQIDNTGGAIGSTLYQEWNGCIKNDAGTTALVGAVDSTTAKRDALMGGVTVSVTADNTNDQLNIICNPQTRDVQWTAYIRFTYLGYRNFNLGY